MAQRKNNNTPSSHAKNKIASGIVSNVIIGVFFPSEINFQKNSPID